MNKVTIYTDVDGEPGYTRVGVLHLRDGSVSLEVIDDRARQQLEKVTADAAPYSLKRRVTPDEGEVFLKAIVEQYSYSSYWRMVPESDDTPATTSADS